MFKLPLDISQHTACTKAKHFCAEPCRSEFFFDHGEPVERLFRGTDAAGRLESNGHSCLLGVLTDRPNHYKTNGQSRIGRFFASRSLYEICSGHHGHKAGARDIAEGQQITQFLG